MLELLSENRVLASQRSADIIHVSAALATMSKRPDCLSPEVLHHPQLQRLVSSLDVVLQKGGEQEVPSCIWALAKMRLPDCAEHRLVQLAKKALGMAAALEPQAVSNITWACAALRDRAPLELLMLLPVFSERLLEPDFVSRFSPQGLANVLWAAASLPPEHSLALVSELHVFAQEVRSKATQLDEQGLSTAIWAAAKLSDSDLAAVLPRLTEEVQKKAQDLSPQAFSNIFWAASVLHSTELLQALPSLTGAILEIAERMKPIDLAALAWASGKLYEEVPELREFLEALAPFCAASACKMSGQELANTASAYARCDVLHPPLMRALAEATLKLAPSLSPKSKAVDLPTVLWAFWKLRLQDLELSRAVAEHVKGVLRNTSDWAACALVGSFAEQRALLPEVFQEQVRRSLSVEDVQWCMSRGPEAFHASRRAKAL